MGYILGVLGYIAADVDFYNIEGNSGDSSFLFIDYYSISKTKKGIHIYTHINMYNMNAFVLPYLISDNYLIVVCK
jgi:hypothetical protein